MREIQIAILERAIPLLRPGGTLVYSTCSIETEENQSLVAAILDRHPQLSLKEDVLLLPHINDTDGAYAAVLVSNCAAKS